MAHQYLRVGFNSSVEVNEVNLSLSYGGVVQLHPLCALSIDDMIIGLLYVVGWLDMKGRLTP